MGIFNFMSPGRAQALDTSHHREEGVKDSPGTWPGSCAVPAQGTTGQVGASGVLTFLSCEIKWGIW